MPSAAAVFTSQRLLGLCCFMIAGGATRNIPSSAMWLIRV